MVAGSILTRGARCCVREQDTSFRLLSTEKIVDRDVKPQTKQNKQGKKANTLSLKKRFLSQNVFFPLIHLA